MAAFFVSEIREGAHGEMPNLDGYLAEMATRGETPLIRLSPTLSNTVIPSNRALDGRTRTPGDDGSDPPTGDPPATPPATPPVTPPADPPAGDPPKWKNGEVYDPAKAEEALTASRREATQLKKRLDDLEAKQKAEEDAKLSEEARLKKENDELKAEKQRIEQTVRQQRVQLAVERAARALEFVSEEAALRFLDQDQVTFDAETGQPQNVQALLEQVLKDNAYLKKAAPPTTPTPVPAHPPGGNQAGLTPEQAEQAQKQTARAYAGTF